MIGDATTIRYAPHTICLDARASVRQPRRIPDARDCDARNSSAIVRSIEPHDDGHNAGAARIDRPICSEQGRQSPNTNGRQTGAKSIDIRGRPDSQSEVASDLTPSEKEGGGGSIG